MATTVKRKTVGNSKPQNVRRQTAGKSESGSKIRTKSTKNPETLSYTKAQQETKAVYELLRGTEQTIQLIKTAGVMGRDDDGKWRRMRYCTNQSSIWEDEQEEPFERAQVVIEGDLVVNSSTRTGELLQEFMDRHPSNGVLFKRVDPAKDAQDEVAAQELILDMQFKIREMSQDSNGSQRLREIGSALGFKAAAKNEDINVVKKSLYDLVATPSGAAKFRDAVNDRYSRALALVERAYNNGAISFKNNAVRFAESEDEILVVPTGKSWQNHLASHLASQLTSELWQEFELAAR